MEGLARLVSESLARHGVVPVVDHRRLQWSRWFRCESSFSLLLMPSAPGVFALAEEVMEPGELASTGGKRMLALFQVSEADDLGLAMCRLFSPTSPLRRRFDQGHCFARYAVIEDGALRISTAAMLRNWLAASAESASGIPGRLPADLSSVEIPVGEPSAQDNSVAEVQAPAPVDGRAESGTIIGPAPLPSGF